MSDKRTSPFASVSRLLVAGAVFFTVLLIGAAVITTNMSNEARTALLRDGGDTNARLEAASEIDALLGRSGLSGRMMVYATNPNPDTLALMTDLVSTAESQLSAISSPTEAHARIFTEAAQSRIAESQLAISAIESGTRNPAIIAMEYANGITPFETALGRFRIAEQQAQTVDALNILSLQRIIVIAALAIGIIAMAGAAILFWLGVRQPLRKLADHLEDLMIDEEERDLPESQRADEVGDVARIAAQIRRAQLQAGRLLTFGDDGTLRLRLEGRGAAAVDDALRELSEAADEAKTTAGSLTEAGGKLAGDNKAVMARIEAALEETIAETSGQLHSLSQAGSDVIRIAGDLEGARRSFAGTDEEWRAEMASLGTSMRDEFDRLRNTADRLANITETAVSRSDIASSRLTDITETIAEQQAQTISTADDARAAISARVEVLDAQIEALGTTLDKFETLSADTITPVETAREGLLRSVLGLSAATKEAATATGFWSKEVEAAHAAREFAAAESDADKAYWKKEREALRLQIDSALNDLLDTSARVSSFAEGLQQGAGDLPGRFDALQAEITGLAGKIATFEDAGGDMITKLGGQLSSVHEALQDARDAFYRESVTIGEVTGDLKSLHLRFDAESNIIGEQVAAISDSLETLDGNLEQLSSRLAAPLDLSPVLAALRNEMGQAVTHLTQVVEGQSQQTRTALTSENGAAIARELTEFAEVLEARMTTDTEEMQRLISAMDEMREQLAIQGEAPSAAAIMEPRLVSLSETTRAIAQEVRGISDTLSHVNSDAGDEIIDHIGRVERLQSGMSRAQQAIATSMQEGLSGIARRLRSSDAETAGKQIERAFTSLMQQQLRLDETLRETVTDLGTRIDDLAAEISRGTTPIARADIAEAADQFATKVSESAPARRADTSVPEEADLSAIYDALRGLTDELKDLSVETDEDETPARSEREAS